MSSSLEGFLEEDTASMYDTQLVDNPWHHAEAYHFYLLTHTQLQAGKFVLYLLFSLSLVLYCINSDWPFVVYIFEF